MTLRAVDCQGFAGGFTLGTVRAGFDLIHKAEMKGGFGVINCTSNRHLLPGPWDVQAVDPHEWEPMAKVDFLFGNPPCSGFSQLSDKAFRGVNSPINHCMQAFVDYTARTRPTIACFESVTSAYNVGKPLMERLFAYLRAETGLPYTLYHVKHNNLALGGVAQRRRYFWLASLVPFGVEQPELEQTGTLRAAIGDLEDLDMDWGEQPYRTSPTWWSKAARRDDGVVDGHHPHERAVAHFQRLFDLYEGSKPWEEGEFMAVWARRYYERNGRLPDSWSHNEEKLVKNDFSLGFHQPKRWKYDRPSFVITGGSPVCAMHPTQLRVLTYREIARIMGFPDDWRIQPLRNTPTVQATWGKGIPVGSGEWIATWVRRSIEGQAGSITGTEIGDSEFEIEVMRPLVRAA